MHVRGVIVIVVAERGRGRVSGSVSVRAHDVVDIGLCVAIVAVVAVVVCVAGIGRETSVRQITESTRVCDRRDKKFAVFVE